MKTAVIYLASGNSKRFGYENKLLKNIQRVIMQLRQIITVMVWTD